MQMIPKRLHGSATVRTGMLTNVKLVVQSVIEVMMDGEKESFLPAGLTDAPHGRCSSARPSDESELERKAQRAPPGAEAYPIVVSANVPSCGENLVYRKVMLTDSEAADMK